MKGIKIFMKVKRTDRLMIDLWNIPGWGLGNNPASYSSNGIGKHYAKYHPTHKQCQLTSIDKQSNSVRRKILEALIIHKDKPSFNNKEELVDTMKSIVR